MLETKPSNPLLCHDDSSAIIPRNINVNQNIKREIYRHQVLLALLSQDTS